MVKLCVGPIDLFILALCFLSARNDIVLKYKELCNCCTDLVRIQGLTLGLLPVSPATGYQRNKQTKEWIMWGQWRVKPTLKRGHLAYAVATLEVGHIRGKIGRFDTCRPNVGLNAKSTRAFPRVTESTVWCLQNKLSTAYPTGGHVTRFEHHRRGRPVLLGAVVHQQVQT